MADKKIDELKIEELELVDNSAGNSGVYRIEVYSIAPLANQNRTGWVQGLYDRAGKLVGTRDFDGKFEINPGYKELLKVQGIDIDSKKLTIDDSRVVDSEIDNVRKKQQSEAQRITQQDAQREAQEQLQEEEKGKHYSQNKNC